MRRRPLDSLKFSLSWVETTVATDTEPDIKTFSLSHRESMFGPMIWSPRAIRAGVHVKEAPVSCSQPAPRLKYPGKQQKKENPETPQSHLSFSEIVK